MKIGTLDIGPGHPCAVIAEIGNAHNGSLSRAIRLLDAAKACGASAAKLQSYTPDELIALRGDGPAPAQWGEQGWTMRSLYEKAQTPLDWLPHLYEHASSIGLPLFSSAFGPESLAALEAVGNPCYKIARLDKLSLPLIEAVNATGKPSLCSSESWGSALANFNGDLLYCPPGYPQTDIRLSYDLFHDYADDHRGIGHDAPFVGFSYHGTDHRAPVVAATLGASILEVHFMLDAEPNELEANVSLGEFAFECLVDDVRAMEAIRGD